MPAIAYRATGISEIDLIRPLWNQLNEEHRSRSAHFRTHYEEMRFEDRKAHFCRLHESGHFRLDLASDPATGTCVGYCICSVSADTMGEVESLFVQEAFRSAGIGTALIKRGLAWMDSLGAARKRVSVSSGNEAAWAFYRKFGFFPRMTVLEQTREYD